MTIHLVIPDGHVKEGVNLDHWKAIGNLIVDVQPDCIVNLGDFADMPSLSSYDVGKKEFEGRRYIKDIAAINHAQRLLFDPIYKYNGKQRRTKHKVYKPRQVLTLGNHEQRIARAVSKDAKLDGLIKYRDLKYAEYGWEVHDFLEVVEVDGIHYSHYFTSGVMGNPAASAKALLRTECRSSVMGHVQKMEMEWHPKRNFISLFAGICYTHEEDYLGKQNNALRPGIWLFHNVDGTGQFDPQWISLEQVMKDFG